MLAGRALLGIWRGYSLWPGYRNAAAGQTGAEAVVLVTAPGDTRKDSELVARPALGPRGDPPGSSVFNSSEALWPRTVGAANEA